MKPEATDVETSYFAATAMPDRDWWASLWPAPEALLYRLGIRPGVRVVDLCCGDGYFTAPLSRLVADGAVIAVDLSTEMLERARQEVAREGRHNVRFIQADAREFADRIDEPVDAVFLANTFHGVADKKAICVAIRRALTPGGCLVVVNWHALPCDQTPVLGRPRGPQTELRMSPAETRAAVEPAGFRQVQVTDVGPYHYAAIFEATTGEEESGAGGHFSRRG